MESASNMIINVIHGIMDSKLADYLSLTNILYFIIFILFAFFTKQRIKPLYDIAKLANIKGLYSGKSLNNEIESNIKKSDVIKIKVTRGHGLFVNKESVFYKNMFKNTNVSKKKFTILLLNPCLQSPIIKSRAASNGISTQNYVESVVEVILKCYEANSNPDNPNQINVRFYKDQDIGWRYYLFEDKHNMVVFFCNSHSDISGPKMPMIKVTHKKNNLCDHFNQSFDRICNDSLTQLVIDGNEKNDNSQQDQLASLLVCDHNECKDLIMKTYIELNKRKNFNV